MVCSIQNHLKNLSSAVIFMIVGLKFTTPLSENIFTLECYIMFDKY
jgi:hypothetical protein